MHTKARRGFDVSALAVLAAIAGGAWAFIEIAEEVLEQETHALDERMLLLLRSEDPADPLGPAWFEQMGRDISALGGLAVLALLTLGVIGYYLLEKRRALALLVFVAVGGGWALTSLLKIGFARPRPDLVPHGAVVLTASFPSGHATMTAVTYLTLATLLARSHESRRTKSFLMAWALLLTLLVGMSRVYLGVHWPSDVLAGWMLGATWALVCRFVAMRFGWDKLGLG